MKETLSFVLTSSILLLSGNLSLHASSVGYLSTGIYLMIVTDTFATDFSVFLLAFTLYT